MLLLVFELDLNGFGSVIAIYDGNCSLSLIILAAHISHITYQSFDGLTSITSMMLTLLHEYVRTSIFTLLQQRLFAVYLFPDRVGSRISSGLGQLITESERGNNSLLEGRSHQHEM